MPLFTTLGGLTMHLGTAGIAAEQLTPTQCELLAMLIAAPGMQLSQESVQAALWPEAAPDKARANLDTLLARCRKGLGAMLPGKLSQRYLALNRGSIRLSYCRVDALEYRKLAEEGLQHAGSGKEWQAGNCFYRATRLWQGEFIPKIIGHDTVQTLRDRLLRLREEVASRWAGILLRTGQRAAAIDILEEHLAGNGTNAHCVRELYRLHHDGSPIWEARRVIDRYRQALAREEYPAGEIEELVNAIQASVG